MAEDHYRQAESLLQAAAGAHPAEASLLLARAQVHATLAVSNATREQVLATLAVAAAAGHTDEADKPLLPELGAPRPPERDHPKLGTAGPDVDGRAGGVYI